MFHRLSPLAVLETLKHAFTRVLSVLGELRPPPRPPTPPDERAFNRMQRLRRRYDALIAHIGAGALPPPRPVKSKTSRPAERPAKPRKPDPAPRRKGWLSAAFPEEAPSGPLLARWIGCHPGLQAAALASPEANRLLRSILWAAGENPPDILAKPDRPKPRVSKPPAAPPWVEAEPATSPPDAVLLHPRPIRSPAPPDGRAPLRHAFPRPTSHRTRRRSRDPCQISPAETTPLSHAYFVTFS